MVQLLRHNPVSATSGGPKGIETGLPEPDEPALSAREVSATSGGPKGIETNRAGGTWWITATCFSDLWWP